MSDTDIRGLCESPREAKMPHRLIPSSQLKGEVVRVFPNYKAAYLWGIARYGSGSLTESVRDVPGGWRIERIENQED